ncbi:MAG: hypothetical protein WBQ59_00770, partial [Candidatus Acidiferrum sp.]
VGLVVAVVEEPALAVVRVVEVAEEEQDLAGPAVVEEWAERGEEAVPEADLASAGLAGVAEQRNRENG